ncbi:MAG: MSHA pilin protein MshB [Oceanicoccus sp.]|jgi:MSHA pilin protein MshB
MFKQKQTGFTLVELVIVIVLLGILAAVALPRFLDVTDQAKDASLEGVSGGFSTGAALAKAQWIADGNSIGDADREVVMDGVSAFMNVNGWPANTTGGLDSTNPDTQSPAECLQVWNYVMQNPPQATTSGSLGDSDKYAVTLVEGTPDLCVYSMVFNNALDSQGREFNYNLGTGQVIVTLP